MGIFTKLKLKKKDKNAPTLFDMSGACLCLGGGGARGYAHIGAIKALEEAGLNFDFVTGTSAGSIVGSLYAYGLTADEMIQRSAEINLRDVHNGILITPNDATKIGKIVTDIIGDIDFVGLKRKFAVVTVDLVTGSQYIIDSGNVGVAVSASSCVPLFFRPIVVGDRHLVDGGLLNNIPAETARMLGATKVITVDVNPTRGGSTTSLKTLDVLKATFEIMSSNASVTGLINSDIIIAPDLSQFKSTSGEGSNEMIELGYNAAKAKLPEIIKLFKIKK